MPAICANPISDLLASYEVNPTVCLAIEDGVIVIHIPEHKVILRASPSVLTIIAALVDRSANHHAELEATYCLASISDSLELLLEWKVVIPKGTGNRIVERWRDWGRPAWLLHLASKDTLYAVTIEEKERATREILTAPMPRPYKCGCNVVNSEALPSPGKLNHPRVGPTFLRRRTHRSYLDAPITKKDLSTVLFYAAGTIFEHDTDVFGHVLKKCAPSPGARHPTELYPVIRNCSGLLPGIYHYCSLHHALTPLRQGETREFLSDALLQQTYFIDAGLCCFFTCVVSRLMWKYKSPRIYRLAHLEAGHYCQNLLLAATALGLGVYCTAAIADSLIEKALDIDGVEECLLYAAGAGVPS
jgi:SagB-type dehydrogenase family enzyme